MEANEKKLRENEQYLTDTCKGLEELRVSNKRNLRESQVIALNSLNKTLSDINKYFFTISTLLIPIIFSLINLPEIKKRLSNGDGVLIKMSLIFLMLSLLFGLIHMLADYKFYKKWLQNLEKKLEKWSAISFWPGNPLPEMVIKSVSRYWYYTNSYSYVWTTTMNSSIRIS